MNWLLQILVFGLTALFFFLASVNSTQRKQYALGLGYGILELLSAVVSSSAWAWALKVSGKTDWFLFGLLGYTPMALICISMFAVGVLCVLASIRGLTKKGKATSTAAQD